MFITRNTYSITARCNRIKRQAAINFKAGPVYKGLWREGEGGTKFSPWIFNGGRPAIKDKAGPTLAILFPPPPLPSFPLKVVATPPRSVSSFLPLLLLLLPLPTDVHTHRLFHLFPHFRVLPAGKRHRQPPHRFVPVAFHEQTSRQSPGRGTSPSF